MLAAGLAACLAAGLIPVAALADASSPASPASPAPATSAQASPAASPSASPAGTAPTQAVHPSPASSGTLPESSGTLQNSKAQGQLIGALTASEAHALMLEKSVEQAQMNLLALGQQLLDQQRLLLATNQRLNDVAAQRQSVTARLQGDRVTLGTVVRRLYKHQNSFFTALLRAGGFGPLLQIIGYSDVLVDHEQVAIRQVHADEVALRHAEAMLARSRNQQQALVDQLSQTHLALGAQLGQEQTLQAQLQAAIADALQALDASQTDSPGAAEARAQLVQLKTDALLRQIEQTVGAQDVLLRVAALAPDDPTLRATGRLLWPIPNATITQGFGPTAFTFEAAYAGFAHFHTGVDLSVPLGTPVFAAADGLVADAQAMTDASGNLVGYGNYIIIQHSTGLETLYGHLLSILVKPGQTVQRGQLIGLVGSTGNSTGPHTHFEVRIDNAPVDPMQLLPQRRPDVPVGAIASTASVP